MVPEQVRKTNVDYQDSNARNAVADNFYLERKCFVSTKTKSSSQLGSRHNGIDALSFERAGNLKTDVGSLQKDKLQEMAHLMGEDNGSKKSGRIGNLN